MKKLVSILRDKRTQYMLIVWILLLKIIEITVSLLSEVEYLRFLAVLGFDSLSVTSRLIWNVLVIFTFFWLIFRLSRDVFKLSVALRSMSRKELLSLIILIVWTLSALITVLQFTILVTTPLANPKLEVSRYYAPLSMENGDSSVMLNDVEGNKVALSLLMSVFTDPFSIDKSREVFQRGTNVGTSYFTVKNSSLGQRMIEMRFCGNGSDQIQGWFANKVVLQNPILINENETFILLLKLTASSDGTAWTYIKMDFLSKENEAYTLSWKFHDVPMNYVFSSYNETRNNYLIGSATDWSFYQFDLNAIFYTSFSHGPRCITGIEYGVGAEADNDIAVQFLLAKISPQPLEVDEMRVKNVEPSIEFKDDYSIRLRGLEITKLFVVLIPSITEKNANVQWSMLKISRSESYRWNTGSFSNMTGMKISFNITSNSTKLFLDGNEIAPKPQNQQPTVYKLDTQQAEVTLAVVNEIDVFLLPLSVLVPIVASLLYAFKRTKRFRIKLQFIK
jgi:hypothetical protein